MRARIVPPCSLGVVPGAEALLEVGNVSARRLEMAGASLLAHASLWIDWRIEAWGARRQGHLHMVRSLGLRGEPWREIDLARHPLRTWPPGAAVQNGRPARGSGGARGSDRSSDGAAAADPVEALLQSALAAAEADLLVWLTTWRLVAYRFPQLGLVSDIGETRHQVLGRLLAAFRPELQRRLSRLDQAQPSTSAAEDPLQLRAELGREMARLADSIEELHLNVPADVVRKLELGVLVVAPDIELGSSR